MPWCEGVKTRPHVHASPCHGEKSWTGCGLCQLTQGSSTQEPSPHLAAPVVTPCWRLSEPASSQPCASRAPGVLGRARTGLRCFGTGGSCFLEHPCFLPVSRAKSFLAGVNLGLKSQRTIGKQHFQSYLCSSWQGRTNSRVCTGPNYSLISSTSSACRFSFGLAKAPTHTRGTRQLPRLRSISRPIRQGETWQLR